MAHSPDALRLASSADRSLADVVLESLSDAVLVVDGRHPHLPVIHSNRAACRALLPERDPGSLRSTSAFRLIAPVSLGEIERRTQFSEGESTGTIVWRLAGGDHPLNTQIRAIKWSSGLNAFVFSFSTALPHFDMKSAVERLPVGIVLADPDLLITYANEAARQQGVDSPAKQGRLSLRDVCPFSSLPRGALLQVLAGASLVQEAFVVEQPDGSRRWFDIDIRYFEDGRGMTGLLATLSDVTARQLRYTESERRVLALTAHARDIISIADTEGRVQYVSGGVLNSLGYAQEERRSNSIFEHMHPEDSPRVRARFRQLVEGDIKIFTEEIRLRHKDGSYRWLESSYQDVLGDPQIRGVVINSRDITERKEAEQRLAQREEVFRLAADAVDGVIFEWDISRGVVQRSRGVQKVLGMQPEDLASHDIWQERIHPRDFEQSRRAISLALLNGQGWATTYRIRDAGGRYRSILERGLIQRGASGDPVRAIGCAVDVSEIQRLNDLLADTQRVAKIGGWEFIFATRELIWNEEMYRIFETTPRTFSPSWERMLECFTVPAAQRFRDALAQAEQSGGAFDLELEICTLRQQRLWVRLVGHLEILDGRAARAYGSLQNVQAQKLSQMALENSTGWLRLSMNMAHLHAWRWDQLRDAFEFTTLEGHQVRLPGVYAGMEMFLAKVHPADQNGVRQAIERAFAERADVREDFRLLGTDGTYRAYASTARPLFDESGAKQGLVGVLQDVSELRESERRVRRSEELLRTTTANTADTLYLLDRALRVRFINRAVNGLSIESLVGGEVDALLPADQCGWVRERLRALLQSGEDAVFEFKIRLQGREVYFENHAVLVREFGLGVGISVSMRDITERKLLEQEILDASTRERQRIGRDLHDGLGQELTGVALMLRGLATKIRQRCPDVVEQVNEVVGLVNQSIETTRSLARGLLPVRTETGGLCFALRSLAERSRDLYGVDVHFIEDTTPEFSLEETSASHLYRIAQEALSNASRHGEATRVEIELRARGEQLSLRIIDDGRGFDPAAPPPGGLGLRIMAYRAGMIGARFEIEAARPQGTVIRVTSERGRPSRALATLQSGEQA